MSMATLPARVAAGLFFLNSGYGKMNLPEEAAKGLRDMGSAGVPQLSQVEPKTFGKALSYGEMAIGATLLTPFIPNWLAGAALGAFGGGLVNMYLNTPGMTKEDGVRPTQEGTALAKDAWLVGIAASLILDSVINGKKKSKK